MGLTRVTVAIRNPAERDRYWEGLFLVDTGATDCLAPRKHLEAIGLVSERQRAYELADGTKLVMDITGAMVEFMGDVAWSAIIMGADDAEPLLGVTALESVGIEVDPINQTLERMPAVPLKGGFKQAGPSSPAQ